MAEENHFSYVSQEAEGVGRDEASSKAHTPVTHVPQSTSGMTSSVLQLPDGVAALWANQLAAAPPPPPARDDGFLRGFGGYFAQPTADE